ncbi:BTB/POZ domain-containing protein [Ditylenchus destructor]|nr:BTB/POZ domain-containing protein [Ditylenchus destructor]
MTEKGTLELKIDQSFMTSKQYMPSPQQPIPITSTAYIHGQVWEVKAQVWPFHQSQITFCLRCCGGDDDKSCNGPGFLPAGFLLSGAMPSGPMPSEHLFSGPMPSGHLPVGSMLSGQKRSAKMMMGLPALLPSGQMQIGPLHPGMMHQQAQTQYPIVTYPSCRATASLHIVSQKEGVDDIVTHKVDNFSNVQWSQLESMRCDVLLNPDNGFIKDDTVIVRVHVTAEMPQGVENAKSNEFVSSISDPPDGVLIVGGNRIPIHKTYLSFYSDFFKTLFCGKFKESGEYEIVLEDVGYEEMLELLSVIYPSNAPITENNINAILKLADRFIMPSVLERCKKELKSSTNINGALKLLLAQRYNFTDLQIQLAQQYKTMDDVSKLKMEPEYKLLNSNALALIFNSIGSGYPNRMMIG